MRGIPENLLMAALLLLGAAQTTQALTIEASQARIKTIGDINGDAWNLWSNGDWGEYLHFDAAGDYRIRVRCRGSAVGGVWSEMVLKIDDQASSPVTVSWSEPAETVFPLRTGPGDYRVVVSFLNDAVSETEDRNLYLLSMTIEPVGDAPEPTLTTAEDCQTDWLKRFNDREAATLAQARKSLETHRKRDATLSVINSDGRPLANAAIKVELTRHDFLFGANIFMFDHFANAEDNDLYKERFRDLFNYATTGFYWIAYEPERGKPDYAYTDKVVDWCARNGIRVKGHPLLWGYPAGIPPWSQGQPPEDVQRQRVSDIVSRYAGKIDTWEVVNEPSHQTSITIDEPYRWARQANPGAQLIVNDYDIFTRGAPPFFKLLTEAIGHGVPFDGIGIQAHEPPATRFAMDQIWKVLDHYATLGKPLKITEFCPTSSGEAMNGMGPSATWDEASQADYVKRFYTVCFAHPAVVAITWWDLSDAGSWRKGGGLLHADLSPKPAYNVLHDLIRGEWTTRAEGRTGDDGRFAFRGFMGDYVARITLDGKTIERPFHVGPEVNGNIGIDLAASPTQ